MPWASDHRVAEAAQADPTAEVGPTVGASPKAAVYRRAGVDPVAEAGRTAGVDPSAGIGRAAGVDPTSYGLALPGYGDQHDFELLLETDFSPEEVIQIISVNGAKVLVLLCQLP